MHTRAVHHLVAVTLSLAQSSQLSRINPGQQRPQTLAPVLSILWVAGEQTLCFEQQRTVTIRTGFQGLQPAAQIHTLTQDVSL